MGCTLFWVKFGHAFTYLWFRFTSPHGAIVQYKFLLIARPDCAILFLACKRKYIFAQESFYLQGILDDINEDHTSFLDCKHKHMMKSGAPPDKFGVLYRMVTYRIPWFHKQN